MISGTGGLPPLIIRADASSQMGVGHVMRCLALGQAWQDRGGKVVFIMAQAPPALEARLKLEGIEVIGLSARPGSIEDARQTTARVQERRACWLVVDGYQFEADYQGEIKQSQISLLVVDDYGHAGQYWADLVLNQNVYAHEGLYPHRAPYSRLLLGTSYALLRREFLTWQGWRREIPEVARKVLITLGGGDPENVTGKVLRALGATGLDGQEVVVLAGGANPHLAALEAQIAGLPFSARLAINATNMPELMAWADVGITGGGSTCWETAFMGLPSLVIVKAENQRLIADRLTDLAAVVNLGWYENLDSIRVSEVCSVFMLSKQSRKELFERNQLLVDGHGSSRVTKELVE